VLRAAPGVAYETAPEGQKRRPPRAESPSAPRRSRGPGAVARAGGRACRDGVPTEARGVPAGTACRRRRAGCRPGRRAGPRRGVPAQGARAARRRPECVEPLWRRSACPTGAPVLPDRTPAGGVSGLPRRAMGYRRDADLGPRRGRSRPAPAGGVTTEWPAVRVDARGGGRGHRAGVPLRSLCLTQRRELRGRLYGLAHQLAQRALLRAAGGRRGEHVFGRLRRGSDGTRTLRSSVRQMARIWL
jgi:hypothetical protein